MIKKLPLIFLLFLTFSCSSKISNFNSYLPHHLPKTSFMPSAELAEGNLPKVVVFEFEEGKNKTANQADLGNSITVAVENVLSQNSLAQLVDRKAAKKLKKEVALAEMNKSGIYKGPQVADYAISGSILNASFDKKYRGGYIIPTGNGGFTRVLPSFTYRGGVSGNLKIYEIPSMKVIKDFEFVGKRAKKEEVKASNNIVIAGLFEFGGQKSEGLKRDDGLVRRAGKEAIENIAPEIKSFFARKAFILEKRVLRKKSIFKISVGKSDRIKIGDKFEIIGQYEIENPLTGESEIEHRIITSGKVSNKINPDYSWVLVDDKESVNRIRLGDVVRFKYERGFFDKIGRMLRP
ncbi:MAG: hypothetical protein ACJAW3_000980 [Lentimonas sp.]|jgi:hypothetical protein